MRPDEDVIAAPLRADTWHRLVLVVTELGSMRETTFESGQVKRDVATDTFTT